MVRKIFNFSENFLLGPKKGWTSIIEVFVSILLIAAMLSFALSNGAVKKPGIEAQVHKEQALVLKKIQLNDDFRGEIISNNDNELSQNIINFIDGEMPDYLECGAKLCILNNNCNLDAPPENKEIFAKSAMITTGGNTYNPKELKLFCWEK